MPFTLSLENRVALVTGGSRGIGRAIALELAARGAAVVVNYNRSPKAAEDVVKQIQDAGGKAAHHQADVSDFKQAETLVKFAVETFGDLGILVNNAGITRDQLIMMMPEADWDAVITTNLKSTFNCSKAAVKHMLRKRYGRVINIASVAGQMGNAGQTNYSASKAGSDLLALSYFTTYRSPVVVTRGVGSTLARASIVTPGSTRPPVSATFPTIVPVCCAAASAGSSTRHIASSTPAEAKRHDSSVIFILPSPQARNGGEREIPPLF